MLSENIEALTETFVKYAATGVELAPVAVVSIATVLRDCADQARALEAQIVPAGARVVVPEEAGENVVAFAPPHAPAAGDGP